MYRGKTKKRALKKALLQVFMKNGNDQVYNVAKTCLLLPAQKI